MGTLQQGMPFRVHILELRKRLLAVFISIVLFSAGGYFIFPYFYNFIQKILAEELFATKIYEGFFTRFRIAVLIGLFVSIPLLLYQIMMYVLPALRTNEKRFVLILLFSSFLLFSGGILFAIKYVLPLSVHFLKSREFFPSGLNRIISYESFILFFFQFIVAFGICLQFPVILLLLLRFGILKRKGLVKFMKYFIPAALLVAGILTPPDIVSQVMLAVPLIFLYVLCILIAKIFKWG